MVSDFETCWWQTTNYLSSQLTKVSNTEIDQTKLRDRCEHNFMQLGFPESRITEKSSVEHWFIKTKAKVFIQKMMAWLKLNEIRSIIKMGSFSKVEFCSKTFLQHLWKFNKIAKINCSIATLYLLNTHHSWNTVWCVQMKHKFYGENSNAGCELVLMDRTSMWV
jgi:hypothetical protein